MPRPRRQRARARVRGLAPRPVGPPSTVGRPPVAASSSGEGRQRHPRLALVAAEDRRRQPRRVATFPAVGRRSPAPEPRTPPPLLLRAVGVLSRCAAAVAPAPDLLVVLGRALGWLAVRGNARPPSPRRG